MRWTTNKAEKTTNSKQGQQAGAGGHGRKEAWVIVPDYATETRESPKTLALVTVPEGT